MHLCRSSSKLSKSDDFATSREVHRIFKYGCEQDANIALSPSILKSAENRYWRPVRQLSKMIDPCPIFRFIDISFFFYCEKRCQKLSVEPQMIFCKISVAEKKKIFYNASCLISSSGGDLK